MNRLKKVQSFVSNIHPLINGYVVLLWSCTSLLIAASLLMLLVRG